MKTELLYEAPGHGGAAARHERSWDRVLVRALAPALDRQLATGRPLESSRALRIRAREIVARPARQYLAESWANVLALASRPPVPRSPRAVYSGAVAAAAPELRAMISVLTSGRPIDARGAAIASSLLRDGAGPLYNRRSPVDLAAVVRAATLQMDPRADREEREDSACAWRYR